MTSSITQTVDTLAQAFQEFKSTNDQRLKDLETGHKVDGLVEEKLARLEKVIAQKSHELSQRETAVKRPYMRGHDTGSDLNFEAKAAFKNYVTKGDATALCGFETKGLSAQSDVDGGYLIPQVLSQQFDLALEELSVMRKLADITSITSSSLDLLIMGNNTQVGWAGESDARNATQTPKVKKITIPVHEMYARPQATQKLLEDTAIDVESWLSKAIAYQMATTETKAFLHGDGDRKPKGIFAYNFKETADEESFQGITKEESLTTDDLIAAHGSLERRYLKQASWLMSRATLAKIRRLKDGDGRYLWQPSFEASHPATILGHPVEVCDEMQEASMEMLFGDFKAAYKIVDRQGIYVLRDPFSAKPYIEFYTTKRVGGNVVDLKALIGLKGV